MPDIVVADIDEQILRHVESGAILNRPTLPEELMILIVDGSTAIHDPSTVRSAFQNATLELDHYRTLAELAGR
jgi:hypothetical protein